MRMGKGAGKLSTWYTHLYGGVFVVEFKNLRPGRAAYYGKQVRHKLPIQSFFYSYYTKPIKLSGGQKTNVNFSKFV